MKFPRKTSVQDDGDALAGDDSDVPRPERRRADKPAKFKQSGKGSKRGYLDGQMLIAMPSMGDDRFVRSVIYVCAHSTEGAMGIVVNQPAAHISFADLLVQLEVIPAAELITLPIDEGICLTATLDILKAIARGEGPQSAILALGYAGWAPGQLENEIQHNGWLHCTADAELIFGQDTGGKYEKALKKIGIDLGMLSSQSGHA
jgi:putative transcriptional regulator